MQTGSAASGLIFGLIFGIFGTKIAALKRTSPVTAKTDSPNPFLEKFPRKKNNDGAWVSVGEGGCPTFDMVLELDKDRFANELLKQLADTLNLSSKNEKLLFGFVIAAAKRFEINTEPVFLDLAQAKKYAAKKGSSISKSTFQRCLKSFSDAGLIFPSEKKSWFFLNPDIFNLTDEFSVRVKYLVGKKVAKCAQTEDFFAGNECIMVPRG